MYTEVEKILLIHICLEITNGPPVTCYLNHVPRLPDVAWFYKLVL